MLPVVLIHGFASNSSDWSYLAAFLRRKSLPVYCLQYAERTETATAVIELSQQMHRLDAAIRNLVQEHTQEFQHGYNIVAHSQGAVLARGAIIKFGLAAFCKVHVLMSLAGPHLGLRQITEEMIRISCDMGHPAHAPLVKTFMDRCAQEVAKGDSLIPVRLRAGVLKDFAPISLYRPMDQAAPVGDFLWDFVEGIDEVPGARVNLEAVGEYWFLAGADDAVVDPASALFEVPAHGFPAVLASMEERTRRRTVAGIGHSDWLSPTQTKAWQEHLLEPLLAEVVSNPGGSVKSNGSEGGAAWQRMTSLSTTESDPEDRERVV
jgi:pimeloyl-ACP methyl ester carboxylesterase